MEKLARFILETFQDHIQKQANKNREKYFAKLGLNLVKTQVDKVLKFCKTLIVVLWANASIEFAVDSGLLGVLTLAQQSLVVLKECLQVADRVLTKLT